jgi:phospholipid transport system substrate-binding protein
MMLFTARYRFTLTQLVLWFAIVVFGPAPAAVASDVTAPVERLQAGLTQVMRAGRAASFRQRYDKLAPVIAGTFDLQAILRQVIGVRWTSLPPDQQAALEDAFQRYTIASYVAAFDDFSGQGFEMLPGISAVGNDRVVQTRITGPSGQVHTLAYVLRQTGGGWRIVDVLAEGSISRVAAQRSEVRSVLSDGGGTALLVSLRRKTAELSGGILQ